MVLGYIIYILKSDILALYFARKILLISIRAHLFAFKRNSLRSSKELYAPFPVPPVME